jgi:SAM-dependent methyltransferase
MQRNRGRVRKVLQKAGRDAGTVKRFYQTSYGLARVLDEAAEVEFAQQWQTYRKLVDNNDVFHLEAYATLHRILVDEVAGPFRFLDLACGDARGIVEMLKTTKVAHYHGVDLSRPVLDLARVALEALACPGRARSARLHRRHGPPEPADVVWIGLSLHHLQRPTS